MLWHDITSGICQLQVTVPKSKPITLTNKSLAASLHL